MMQSINSLQLTIRQLNGKTVVISGGAEGIGFSIAQAMGKQGMNVVLGDIDQEQLQLAKQKLAAQNIDVLAHALDVTDLGVSTRGNRNDQP